MIELVQTDGVFALDGGEWDVTNNIWLVGSDTEVVRLIQQLRGDARLFSFGIGSSVNRYLLKEMARVGRGAARIVRGSAVIRGWSNYFRIAHNFSQAANMLDHQAFWIATRALCRKFDLTTAKCLHRYRFGSHQRTTFVDADDRAKPISAQALRGREIELATQRFRCNPERLVV